MAENWRTQLASAPKKQSDELSGRPGMSPGTWVRAKAYDIANAKTGFPSSRSGPDHMFIEYDDGARQLIARGGPSAEGAKLIADGLDGNLMVRAVVTPAAKSKDYGHGQRVLYETFIPYKTAEEVAAPARRIADSVNHATNLYNFAGNSNSFAADVAEATFGRRVGDEQTPGYENRLRTGGFNPETRASRASLGTGFGSTRLGRGLYRIGSAFADYVPDRDPRLSW